MQDNEFQGTPKERLFANSLESWFNTKYVMRVEFAPVKLIAYGAVALVAAAFLTGLGAYIYK